MKGIFLGLIVLSAFLLKAEETQVTSDNTNLYEVPLVVKINFKEFREKNTMEFIESLDFYKENVDKALRGKTNKVIAQLLLNPDSTGVDKSKAIYAFGEQRGDIYGMNMVFELTDPIRFENWYNQGPGMMLFKKFEEQNGIKMISLSENIHFYISGNQAGFITTYELDVDEQSVDYEEDYLAKRIAKNAKKKENSLRFALNAINNYGQSLKEVKSNKGFKDFDSDNFEFGIWLDIEKVAGLYSTYLSSIMSAYGNLMSNDNPFLGMEDSGLSSDWTKESSMSVIIDFKMERMDILTHFYSSEMQKKTFKKVYCNKLDKKYFPFVTREAIGFGSMSFNPGEAVDATLDSYKNGFSGLGSMGTAMETYANLIQLFVDEKGINDLVDGDAFYTILDIKEVQKIRTRNRYDSDLGEYVERMDTSMNEEPVLFFAIGLGKESHTDGILKSMSTFNLLDKDDNGIYTVSKGGRRDLKFSFKVADGMLLISNEKLVISDMLAKSRSKKYDVDKKLLRKNTMVVEFSWLNLIHGLKNVGEIKDRDSLMIQEVEKYPGKIQLVTSKMKGRKISTTLSLIPGVEGYSIHTLFNFAQGMYDAEEKMKMIRRGKYQGRAETIESTESYYHEETEELYEEHNHDQVYEEESYPEQEYLDYDIEVVEEDVFIEVEDRIEVVEEVEEEIYRFTEIPAEFIGGNEAMYTFINNNITYPEVAKEEGISGKVYIEFIVEKDGSISSPKIMRSPHNLLSNEAIRIINSMPNWTPGKQKGKAVRCYFVLPINFSLK